MLVPALLGLTAVTGMVDAVSYLGLGHVFTANMTGNVVFLGFAAAGAEGLSVARSTAALAAFLVGAVVGGRMAVRMGAGPWNRWAGTAFGAEGLFLLFATAVAATADGNVRPDSPDVYALIVLTGVAMGIRNATVRRLGVSDLTTTVLTLTLTGLAADSRLAGGTGSGSRRRVASVLVMLAGAAVGTGLLSVSLAIALGACAAVSSAAALAVTFRGLSGRLP